MASRVETASGSWAPGVASFDEFADRRAAFVDPDTSVETETALVPAAHDAGSLDTPAVVDIAEVLSTCR